MKSTTDTGQMAQEQHPADALGETLERVDTLLSAIGAMFEPGRETFAVNASYIMHSLLAAQGLVVAAQTSLGQLVDQDFKVQSVAQQPGFAEVDREPIRPNSSRDEHVSEDELEPEPIPYTPFSGSRFTSDMKSSASNTEFAEILNERSAPAAPIERTVSAEAFAQNYLELLRKLTAAEIFAAEQQALSPPGTQHQLLPLLRSLREDFQKINSAA